jgi:RNA polymerase sigma factor (sigma-70 family)
LILALCRRMLGDPTLAEDATQEASLQALVGLDRLQSGERFGAWLAGIGLNVCRMWLRARARECWLWDALHRAVDVREAHHDAGARAEAADLIARVYDAVADVQGRDDPQAHATTADLVMCVRRAVAELPRGQRAAVLLFYLSGLSYAETAALLGIDVGAVRTRLHKARGALRTHLWAVGKEENMVMEGEHTEKVTITEGERKHYTCSFCGKDQEQVHRMIAGPGGVAICDACIATCNQIIAEEEAKSSAS